LIDHVAGASTTPAIKYRLTLSEDEKTELEALLKKGKSAAHKQIRARILLKAATGCRDEKIVQVLNVSVSRVAKTRQRCVEEGEAALNDRPRPDQKPKLTDRQAAHMIAIACSDAPDGHDHWTLRLLADKVVELDYAESCPCTKRFPPKKRRRWPASSNSIKPYKPSLNLFRNELKRLRAIALCVFYYFYQIVAKCRHDASANQCSAKSICYAEIARLP